VPILSALNAGGQNFGSRGIAQFRSEAGVAHPLRLYIEKCAEMISSSDGQGPPLNIDSVLK